MTSTVQFLTVGLLLLVALFLFLRSSSASSKINGRSQAQEILNTLQAELLPDWFVNRIFSMEDWEFARSQEAPGILQSFHSERKAVALSWLRQTQDYVAQLMDFHVRLSRQRPDLGPATEVRLTLEYVEFQFICRLLAAMIGIAGPIRVGTLARRAVDMATHLGEMSETLLARFHDVVPVKAAQN